jgi:hypothetical protein
MIPLPGASFVYSLLKDVGNWSLTRLRGRRVQLWAKGWTVGDWYPPALAAEKFGDQDRLQHRKNAQQQLEKVWAERDELWDDVLDFNKRYEDAQGTVDLFTDLICEDLRQRLARGELIARGFREPFAPGAPYLTISRHEWRIIKLDLPDRAEGSDAGYVGLTIGKVGTKSLFRRRTQ